MPELERTQRLASGPSEANDLQMFLGRKKKNSSEQVCLKHRSSVVETSSNTTLSRRIRPSDSSPVFGTRDLRHEPRVNKLSAEGPLIRESDPTHDLSDRQQLLSVKLGHVQSDFNGSANRSFSFLFKSEMI